MYCSYCGKALKENAAFCSVCGKPTDLRRPGPDQGRTAATAAPMTQTRPVAPGKAPPGFGDRAPTVASAQPVSPHYPPVANSTAVPPGQSPLLIGRKEKLLYSLLAPATVLILASCWILLSVITNAKWEKDYQDEGFILSYYKLYLLLTVLIFIQSLFLVFFPQFSKRLRRPQVRPLLFLGTALEFLRLYFDNALYYVLRLSNIEDENLWYWMTSISALLFAVLAAVLSHRFLTGVQLGGQLLWHDAPGKRRGTVAVLALTPVFLSGIAVACSHFVPKWIELPESSADFDNFEAYNEAWNHAYNLQNVINYGFRYFCLILFIAVLLCLLRTRNRKLSARLCLTAAFPFAALQFAVCLEDVFFAVFNMNLESNEKIFSDGAQTLVQMIPYPAAAILFSIPATILAVRYLKAVTDRPQRLR